MTYAELVQLYFERSGALQSYWTLYVVILGGVLAFSSLRQIPNRLTTILITVLFLSFAYKNCGAIVDVTNQRLAVLASIEAINLNLTPAEAIGTMMPPVVPAEREVRKHLTPTMIGTDVRGVRRFHAFCDALTVLTLWSMEWRRRSRARDLAAEAR